MILPHFRRLPNTWKPANPYGVRVSNFIRWFWEMKFSCYDTCASWMTACTVWCDGSCAGASSAQRTGTEHLQPSSEVLLQLNGDAISSAVPLPDGHFDYALHSAHAGGGFSFVQIQCPHNKHTDKPSCNRLAGVQEHKWLRFHVPLIPAYLQTLCTRLFALVGQSTATPKRSANRMAITCKSSYYPEIPAKAYSGNPMIFYQIDSQGEM